MGNYQHYATARVKTKISLQTRIKSQLREENRLGGKFPTKKFYYVREEETKLQDEEQIPTPFK